MPLESVFPQRSLILQVQLTQFLVSEEKKVHLIGRFSTVDMVCRTNCLFYINMTCACAIFCVGQKL